MSNQGRAILIVFSVVVALIIIGAFLFLGPTASGISGPPGSSPPRGAPSVSFAVSYQRTPSGVIATVLATNSGSEDLKNLRITQVTITSMSGGGSLPPVVERLPRGAKTTFTLPFSGAVSSSPTSHIQLNITYEYRYGWFGKGSGSTSVTSLLP